MLTLAFIFQRLCLDSSVNIEHHLFDRRMGAMITNSWSRRWSTMITAAFILAGVINHWRHSARITAAVIAADCSQMTSMITLTLNPNPSTVEWIPVVEHKNVLCNTLHEIVKLTFRFRISPCRHAKPCCDWWIPYTSPHALTVFALSIAWRDQYSKLFAGDN